jgi:hypothetical protein
MTATWVTTTRPLGTGLVVPVLLLLGGAVQALTPILVAVPATILGPTTRPLGIGVVVLALLLLGAAVLALRPILVVDGHADDPRIQYPTYSRGGGDFDVPRRDPCSRRSGQFPLLDAAGVPLDAGEVHSTRRWPRIPLDVGEDLSARRRPRIQLDTGDDLTTFL